MPKWKKVLEQAKNAPQNVRYEDLCALAVHFGFEQRKGGDGSHKKFKRPGYQTLVFQKANDGKAKPYQVDQLLEAIELLGLDENEN